MSPGVEVPVLSAGSWTVSDSRTRVTFAVRNFGRPARGSVACRWGELDVDASGAPVRVAAELDLESLDTGIARRDADLRRPGFLDIDRHPTMSWVADRFEQSDHGRWTADGTLTVRGTGAPVTVTALADVLPDGWLRVRATASLDRRAVGIRAPRFLIGCTVQIDIDAWLSVVVPD